MSEDRRHMSDEKQKDLYKQAWKELLNEVVQEFGWWSLKAIGVLLIGAVIYFILTSQGWIAPPEIHPTIQQSK